MTLSQKIEKKIWKGIGPQINIDNIRVCGDCDVLSLYKNSSQNLRIYKIIIIFAPKVANKRAKREEKK